MTSSTMRGGFVRIISRSFSLPSLRRIFASEPPSGAASTETPRISSLFARMMCVPDVASTFTRIWPAPSAAVSRSTL
jgi:hypothetical protein